MDRVARHVFVSGRVQGVGFRWSTCDRARELALDGWVRNLADGRVETWVEGDAESVRAMLAWLRNGPPAARVTGLEERDAEPAGHATFESRPTAFG